MKRQCGAPANRSSGSARARFVQCFKHEPGRYYRSVYCVRWASLCTAAAASGCRCAGHPRPALAEPKARRLRARG
eukprot:13119956-Alexandrium_andersonii.AAC.1